MRYVHPAERGLNDYDEYKIALKEWEELIKNNLEAKRADRLYKAKVAEQVAEYNKVYKKEKTMTDKKEIIFADGFSASEKIVNGNNGEFRIIKVGINYEKFTEFCAKYVNKKGYVNIDIKTSKDGTKLYGELNTYYLDKPEETPKEDEQIIQFADDDYEGVPF